MTYLVTYLGSTGYYPCFRVVELPITLKSSLEPLKYGGSGSTHLSGSMVEVIRACPNPGFFLGGDPRSSYSLPGSRMVQAWMTHIVVVIFSNSNFFFGLEQRSERR